MEIFIDVLTMGIFVISITVLYIMRKEKNDRSHDYHDDLIQQEQMDRIEKSMEDIRHRVFKNEKSNKDYPSLETMKEMKRIKEGKPLDPTRWIKRTNRFNNQFIIQRINDKERMQCVTCGSSEISCTFAYSGESWATEKVYTCDKCDNSYTVREGRR